MSTRRLGEGARRRCCRRGPPVRQGATGQSGCIPARGDTQRSGRRALSPRSSLPLQAQAPRRLQILTLWPRRRGWWATATGKDGVGGQAERRCTPNRGVMVMGEVRRRRWGSETVARALSPHRCIARVGSGGDANNLKGASQGEGGCSQCMREVEGEAEEPGVVCRGGQCMTAAAPFLHPEASSSKAAPPR